MKNYSAATYDGWVFGPIGNPYVMATISNPSGSTVQSRLRNLCFILSTNTAYSGLGVVLNICSTTPTGGTSTTLTPAQMNSNDPAPSTVITLYTSMPTLTGTSTTIRMTQASVPTSGGSVRDSITQWDNLGNGEGILILPGQSVLLVAANTIPYATEALMYLDFSEE